MKNQIVPLALPSAIKSENGHQLPLVVLDPQTLQPIAHLPFTDPGSFLIHMFPARFSDDGSTLATSTFNVPGGDNDQNRIDLWRLIRNRKNGNQPSCAITQTDNDTQNERSVTSSCCTSCCAIS